VTGFRSVAVFEIMRLHSPKHHTFSIATNQPVPNVALLLSYKERRLATNFVHSNIEHETVGIIFSIFSHASTIHVHETWFQILVVELTGISVVKGLVYFSLFADVGAAGGNFLKEHHWVFVDPRHCTRLGQ